MNQKSSLIQILKSVPRVLTSDMAGADFLISEIRRARKRGGDFHIIATYPGMPDPASKSPSFATLGRRCRAATALADFLGVPLGMVFHLTLRQTQGLMRAADMIVLPSNAQVTYLERTIGNENEIWVGSVIAVRQFLFGERDRVNCYSIHRIRCLRYRRHQ